MATEVGSDIALIQDEDMLRKMVIYLVEINKVNFLKQVFFYILF